MPKPLPKKGLKRKQKDQLDPSVKNNSSSVKKAKHVTSSESESGSENEVITAPPRKNKEAKNAATKELGDEKRTWSTDEIECLLSIMEEMLEEFNSITKTKKKLWEKVTSFP